MLLVVIGLKELTIKKAHKHLVKGDFSALELTRSYLEEIAEKNKNLNAYLEVFDEAEEVAREADRVLQEKKGGASLLTGIPIAVKDNILIKGHKASCGSKILEPYRATYDATAIKKLKGESVVFLGRTNMDEFAMGSSTENSAFGVVKNPHDESRVSGGSSGGSAAALAASCALGALGSDTGGSIRQPAGFCGVVGLKPTYGMVSRSGLVALASSLDQIGPLAKTVEDARILFEAMRGHDPLDSTSIEASVNSNRSTAISHRSAGKKIGVPAHLFKEGVDADVLQNFNASLELLKKEGYTTEEIELPHAKYALAVYYIILPAEASANLARFDGMRYGLKVEGKNLLEDFLETRGAGFGKEVRRRIILGTHVLSSGYYDAYYRQAREVRVLITDDFREVFERVDVVATPSSPTPAFKIGEKASNPILMYLSDVFTVPANIAGIPGISVPSSFVLRDGKKLPLGIQFMASHRCEDVLFEVGSRLEQLQVVHQA